MRSSTHMQLAKLRLLVGSLGENENFGWWKTAFFASSSKTFLLPVYPRTFPLAQYHGVVAAACRDHDERLKLGSFHLFRLPEEVEQDIHVLVNSWDSNSVEAIIGHDRASALSVLADQSGAEEDIVEGPILCGAVQELLSGSAQSKLAAIYHKAFASGLQTYPYFASASE